LKVSLVAPKSINLAFPLENKFRDMSSSVAMTVHKLVSVLERGRKKARFEGDYAAAALDLDSVLRGTGKLLITCEGDPEMTEKLTELENKVSSELQAMREYQRELKMFQAPSVFQGPGGAAAAGGGGGRGGVFGMIDEDGDSISNNNNNNNNNTNNMDGGGVYDDPDVWKPPTSDGRGRRPEMRQQQQQGALLRRPAPSVPSRGGGNANNNIGNNNAGNGRLDRMRQERDNVNSNNSAAAGRVPGSGGAGSRPLGRPAVKPPLPTRNNNNNNNNNNKPSSGYGQQQRPPPSSHGKGGGGGPSSKPSSQAVTNDGERKYSDVAREEGWVDLDLIDSIENDIVEGKVNVSWESIAGLSEAKHLLQEAVVLPLWMPEYVFCTMFFLSSFLSFYFVMASLCLSFDLLLPVCIL
jgi:hypothetical protein